MKELWECMSPSDQAALISSLIMVILGMIVAAILAWLRPVSWPWAVAAGCFTVQIGLSVLALGVGSGSD